MSEVINKRRAQTGFINRPITLLFSLLLLQVALFYQTYWSMVEIWWRSETFAHGFFILPITAYLIWRKRKSLSVIAIQNDWRALIVLAGLSFFWLVAFIVDVLVAQQFAVVMMLPALVWLCLGPRMVVALCFPLFFLLFAVPFGDFLVYPMMEFTASFTVNAIRMVGIPVFWEGMYFTLPSGSWSVVEACSGFRYVLASLTLGALYAYLSYHSFWRRAAFMLLALVVPIVANGLRAFMIVMIGHLSDMELAVGVDHLIYGWVWFGIVMFVMFWIGSFWQQPAVKQDAEDMSLKHLPQQVYRWRFLFSATLVVLVIPVWMSTLSSAAQNQTLTFELPQQAGDWQLMKEPALSQWKPFYQGATRELRASYSKDQIIVGLDVAIFTSQRQGSELVNSSHRLTATGQQIWKEHFRLTRKEHFTDYDVTLTEAHVKSSDQNLLVWQWKYFNGVQTNNDFYLKVLEAWASLTGKPRHAAALIVFIEEPELTKGSESEVRELLKSFVAEMLPLMDAKLDQ